MISFLLGLIVFLLVAGAVWWLARFLELPAKVMQALVAVLVVAFVIYALSAFGVIGGWGGPVQQGPVIIAR